MQIHELDNYSGILDSGAFVAVDNGSDTGKVSATAFLADVNQTIADLDTDLNARIDNIIAGGAAPSEAEIIDARLGAAALGGVQYNSLGSAIRGQATELENALINNTNFMAETNIAPIKSATATVGGLSVTYDKYSISFSGTSSANGSAFITDSFNLEAGDYVISDGIVDNNGDWDVRVLNSNNQALANSVSSPKFTLSATTAVRVLIYIFGNKSFNVDSRISLYKDNGILGNKTISEELKNSSNFNAGANEATMKKGTWSGSGLSVAFDTEKTVITNTASANASFFITDSFTLAAGDYYLFDGLSSHDGLVSLRVIDSNNTVIAAADGAFAFTLSAATSVRLFVYVYAGGGNITLYPTIVDQSLLSNAKLTEITKGLVGYSGTAVNEAIGRGGYYPWRFACPTNAKKAQLYNCVKNITLFGAKEGNQYFLKDCFINNDALNPKGTYITVYDKNNVKVCEYNSLVVPTSRQILNFHEMNNSGITALIDADFTDIADNFQAPASTYAELGISDQCIAISDWDVDILCPSTIYAVVGLETNLYWDSLIQGGDINNVIVEVEGNGLNLGNRWSYTPSAAGSFSITVRVRDLSYRLLAAKTITVVASVYAAGSATIINAIHIGDSMIDNAYHLDHLESDMAGSNITYNIFGTRPHSEGRGGWTSSQYITLAESGGVTNAFFNPNTQKFDFSYYMTQQGYSNIDVVWLFLGTNDVKGQTQFSGIEGSANITIKNLNEIIASIHDYDSDIKIVVNTAGIGAHDQYPYAKMYNNNQIKQALHRYGIQTQVSKILKTYLGREAENIFVCLTGSSLDNVNGFPTTTANVAARISKQETYQSDPYHPTSEGYYQFADCEFAFIRNKLI